MSRHLLFTLQANGHDITQPHAPGQDYTDSGGAYHQIASYLEWPACIWTFESIKDFYNEWFDLYSFLLQKRELWILEVPSEAIRWMALGLQCKNEGAIKDWIFPTPEDIRAAGDIPEGLITAPVEAAWVLCRLPADKVMLNEDMVTW